MTNHTTNQLIELLTHPDGTQRRQAALALGTSADPAAAEALVERLSVESQSFVREDLTWATVQHIDTALPGRTSVTIRGLYRVEAGCRRQPYDQRNFSIRQS